MWAGKDNGSDVNWTNAVKFCRDLRLGGHSDWRLGSLEELKGIFDKTANGPGSAGPHGEIKTMWHVKGGLFLSGNQWSSTRVPGDRGNRQDMRTDLISMKEGRSTETNSTSGPLSALFA